MQGGTRGGKNMPRKPVAGPKSGIPIGGEEKKKTQVFWGILANVGGRETSREKEKGKGGENLIALGEGKNGTVVAMGKNRKGGKGTGLQGDHGGSAQGRRVMLFPKPLEEQ